MCRSCTWPLSCALQPVLVALLVQSSCCYVHSQYILAYKPVLCSLHLPCVHGMYCAYVLSLHVSHMGHTRDLQQTCVG